jgi:hypothetical protein
VTYKGHANLTIVYGTHNFPSGNRANDAIGQLSPAQGWLMPRLGRTNLLSEVTLCSARERMKRSPRLFEILFLFHAIITGELFDLRNFIE